MTLNFDRFTDSDMYTLDETERFGPEHLEIAPDKLIEHHGMFYFVGYYFAALAIYRNLSFMDSERKKPLDLDFESKLETWIGTAENWLPDWAFNLKSELDPLADSDD